MILLQIGINYIRQQNELKGCINDARNVQRFLICEHGSLQHETVTETEFSSIPLQGRGYCHAHRRRCESKAKAHWCQYCRWSRAIPLSLLKGISSSQRSKQCVGLFAMPVPTIPYSSIVSFLVHAVIMKHSHLSWHMRLGTRRANEGQGRR